MRLRFARDIHYPDRGERHTRCQRECGREVALAPLSRHVREFVSEYGLPSGGELRWQLPPRTGGAQYTLDELLAHARISLVIS